MFNAEKIKKDFPILKRKMNGKKLIYLDNASSTQKPRIVINEIKNFYEKYYSNIHRGLHELSKESTEHYNSSREYIAKFFGAQNDEIIFVRNATEGINLLANTLKLKRGDEVIISEMEHHANIVPWWMLKQEKGIKMKIIPFNEEGKINVKNLKQTLSKKTKIVSIVHASNVLGTINPIKKLCEIVKEYSSKIIFISDIAQSAPNMEINFKKLGIDFATFSGHKMLGPSGIGGIIGKSEELKKLKPYQGGGDMIQSVSFNKITYEKPPQKFEAGTPFIEGAIGLKTALIYLKRLGMNNISLHEKQLTDQLIKELKNITSQEINYYGPRLGQKRTGLVAFNIKNIHAHDVSEILNQENIATRSGHHCAQPLHDALRIESSVRASFQVYNTKNDVKQLIYGLNKVIKLFN